jgi:hypothetical protein
LEWTLGVNQLEVLRRHLLNNPRDTKKAMPAMHLRPWSSIQGREALVLGLKYAAAQIATSKDAVGDSWRFKSRAYLQLTARRPPSPAPLRYLGSTAPGSATHRGSKLHAERGSILDAD